MRSGLGSARVLLAGWILAVQRFNRWHDVTPRYSTVGHRRALERLGLGFGQSAPLTGFRLVPHGVRQAFEGRARPWSLDLNSHCGFVWSWRDDVACFAHTEQIQKKTRTRYASQHKKGGGKPRVNDDEAGQRRAKRRADALRGNHGSLGQIEMAGAARQIRDNERKKRAIKARADAIETLDREQPKAIVR
jgi:hypothetical protein